MRTIWVALILIAVALLVPYQSIWGDSKAEDPLKIESEARFVGKGEERKMMLFVRLVNTGEKSITVLTNKDYLDVSTNKDRQTDRVQITLGLYHVSKNEGRLRVPCLYDYSPVTINPNEVASITRFFSDMPAEMTLTVEYSVDKLWGERFDIWSGSLKTEPFRVSSEEKSATETL